MGLFSRRGEQRPRREPPMTEPQRIAGFWQWWVDRGRAMAEESIAGQRDPDEFAQNMTRSVHALGDLAWELAAGTTSRHLLVITPEGEAPKRALARRILLGAPPADDVWAYADSRQPVADPEGVVLRAEGAADLSFADVAVAARKNGQRFDVTVHHPAFADLDERARGTVAFLALDAALGEIDTEVWIGEVTPSEVAPLDSFGLAGLRSVVADLAASHVDADGDPAWVLLQGETPQGRVVAAAQVPLHPSVAPHLDQHVALALPYDAGDDGMPTSEALDRLRSAEDLLGASLAEHGRVVAHQSSGGIRVLHVYVDSTGGGLEQVREVARAWPEGRATVDAMVDPGWLSVQHLRA